ncbi:MAG: sulfatase-like hydrolase/transferase, partial [Vicinamibacterales bacterium]
DESSPRAHWRGRAPGQPFFAVINITTTHEGQIRSTEEQYRKNTARLKPGDFHDPARAALPPYYPDTPLVRRDLARHYDNLAAMDQQAGRILAELAADGLTDETIIFFFSDHGDGLPRSKRWVYDSGIHVPLIVRFPDGTDAGTVNEELVSFVDFAPTMLSLLGLKIPEHMQGQAFLGPKKTGPRKYVYACRDRMDPAPETIRAVRDERFKYIRNYRPDLPYVGYIPYRDQAAIMQEIHRLNRAGQLGPDSWQLWATKKPLEELYDTETDPYEIHNLASDPRYFEKLADLREAHQQWTRETGDLGHMPETELIKKLWPPDGKQPTTADPAIHVDGGTVTIRCETDGASIAYRLNRGDRWLLYTKPFQLGPNDRIEAQAIRLGWKKSGVVSVTTSER